MRVLLILLVLLCQATWAEAPLTHDRANGKNLTRTTNPLPNVRAVLWQLYDDRSDFRKDKELMPKVLCQKDDGVLPYFRVDPANLISVDQNAPFREDEESEEKGDLGASFERAVAKSLDRLAKEEEPILTIGFTGHGTSGEICRPFRKDFTPADLVTVVFDKVEKFEKEQHRKVHVVFLADYCFAGAIIDPLETRISTRDKQSTSFSNGDNNFAFKVDVIAAAPKDRTTVADPKKGGSLWTQLDALNHLPSDLKAKVHASPYEHQRAVCSLDGLNEHTVWSSWYRFPKEMTPYSAVELREMVRKDSGVSERALHALPAKGERGEFALAEIVASEQTELPVAAQALELLSESKSPATIKTLADTARHGSLSLRQMAYQAMQFLDGDKAAPYADNVREGISDPDAKIRKLAFRILKTLENRRGAKSILADEDLQTAAKLSVLNAEVSSILELMNYWERLPADIVSNMMDILAEKPDQRLADAIYQHGHAKKAFYSKLSPKLAKTLLTSPDVSSRNSRINLSHLISDGTFSNHSDVVASLISSKDTPDSNAGMRAARHIHSPAIWKALRDVYHSPDSSEETKLEALHSLALTLPPGEREDFLMDELKKHPSGEIRKTIVFHFGNGVSAKAIASIQRRIESERDIAHKGSLMSLLLQSSTDDAYGEKKKLSKDVQAEIAAFFEKEYEKGTTPLIKATALKAIGNHLGEAALPKIVESLKSKDGELQAAALYSLVELKKPELMKLAVPLLQSSDLEVRQETINLLSENSNDVMAQHFSEMLEANLSNPSIVFRLLFFLGDYRDKHNREGRVDWLLELIRAQAKMPHETKEAKEAFDFLKTEIFAMVRSIPPERARVVLLAALTKAKDPEEKLAWIHQLSNLETQSYLAVLPGLLSNEDPAVRSAALNSLHPQTAQLIKDAGGREKFFADMSKALTAEKDPRVQHQFFNSLTNQTNVTDRLGNARGIAEPEEVLWNWLNSPEATRTKESEMDALKHLFASHFQSPGFVAWELSKFTPLMLAWAEGDEKGRRDLGLSFLAWTASPKLVDLMRMRLDSELRKPSTLSTETTAHLLDYFGKLKSLTMLPLPIKALNHPEAGVRVAALRALCDIREADSAIPGILNSLGDPSPEVRELALLTIEKGALTPETVRKNYDGQGKDTLTTEQKLRLTQILDPKVNENR